MLPTSEEKELKHPENLSMEEHITYLWDYLSREPDREISPYSTFIPLPCSYIVPGGRFREIYYWDSYFTSEGLAVSGKLDMVENMVKNFSFLIDKYGHIPNGNRIYYLSRSQPPFFCCIMEILFRYKGMEAVLPYLSALEKEYFFWMEGERKVILHEGSILNRYWDDNSVAREESYREDIALYNSVDKERKKELYRNIRAACESGWDFSSRWFKDSHNLSTVRTTEILPVDLNSLLYNMEIKLSQWFSTDKIKSNKYKEASENRKKTMYEYFWNEEKGFFFDYCYTDRTRTDIWSLAGTYPIFFKIATEEQSGKVVENISKKFLYPGGLVTTLNET
ncbi:MAG TPA: trehalase family glycosidase, partial [Candidatus Eremiobacteraeota bacterium]|nr:trehalase family glycosidase [Candidatus Eremiobacteraeota bacterium]